MLLSTAHGPIGKRVEHRRPETSLDAVDWLSEEEECVLINSREMPQLWAVLADWTASEDDETWGEFIPRFAEIIQRWEKEGYIEVYRGPEWPAHQGPVLV